MAVKNYDTGPWWSSTCLGSHVSLQWLGQTEQAPICLTLKEVTALTGHQVLKEVDDNISLIVGDPQWIFDLQLRAHSIDLLNIISI